MVASAKELKSILYLDGGTYPMDERLLLEKLFYLLKKTGLLKQYEMEPGRAIHYFLANQIHELEDRCLQP